MIRGGGERQIDDNKKAWVSVSIVPLRPTPILSAHHVGSLVHLLLLLIIVRIIQSSKYVFFVDNGVLLRSKSSEITYFETTRLRLNIIST